MALKLRVLAGPPGVERVPAVERAVEIDDDLPEVRFGRRAGLEVELPFPAVAPIHARLIRRGNGWAVEDLGSTNGTSLDGVMLRPGVPHAVEAGAVIGVGPLSIVFEGAVAPAAASTTGIEGTTTIARRLVSDLFGARDDGQVARLIPIAGWPSDQPAPPPLRLIVPDRSYLAGRGEDCDLVLPSADVSREHAVIVRRWQGVHIRDLGSKNGVRVAGHPITADHRLRDGEHLEIASFALRLDDPEDRYLKSLESPPAAPPVGEAAPEPPPPIEPPPRASHSARIAMAVSILVLLAVAAAIVLIVAN